MEIEDAINCPLLGDLPVETLQRLASRYRRRDDYHFLEKRQARVSIQGGFMTSFLCEVLPLFFAHRGLKVDLREAPYGTFLSEIYDESSPYWLFEADLTYFLPTYRDLLHSPSIGDSAECVGERVEAELSIWRLVWEKIKSPIIQLTFTPPKTRVLDEADGLMPGGKTHYIREVNRTLALNAPPHVTLIDGERLMSRLGAKWYDERLYRVAKQPFSMEAIPTIGNTLAAGGAAAVGLSRKVLILDLDNTLWGGIIGDDGLERIILGPETPEGESFVAFQEYVKALSERGIVLCVCSKNDRELAQEPFIRHSGMVLGLEDIAVFCANFEDKVTNIRSISEALNLGLNSFVFVDDSPVECAFVRERLPEVWTIELSDDPSEFPSLVDRAIPFPTSRITNEDISRTNSYRELGKVHDGIETATDIESFLKGLKPVAIVETVRNDTIDRISQLISKTNQFKLNPTILSSAEVRAWAENILAIRFQDRLQDYGIVAVAVLEPDEGNDTLLIRNWVMSCRVFSRRLEYLTLELIAARAQSANLSTLRLNFQLTKRNGFLHALLLELGFQNNTEAGWFQTDTSSRKSMPAHFIDCDLYHSPTPF